MFKLNCELTRPHTSHRHIKHWEKDDLLELPAHVAMALPETWDVMYLCIGIEAYEPSPVVTAALQAYRYHSWSAGSRTCKCGDFFEASIVGHAMHKQHQMSAVLFAANGDAL